MYREAFPSKLKKARLDANLTQKQVTEKTGIKQENISRYENGKLEPNLETLGILAQLYNVSADWLLGVTIQPTIRPAPVRPRGKKEGS